MGFITRERAALQSTHPTQNVKLIIRYYIDPSQEASVNLCIDKVIKNFILTLF